MDETPTNFEMSLMHVLLNGYTLNQKFYNCTDQSEMQDQNVKQIFYGWYFLMSGITFVTLYIPCVISGLRSDLMNTSCYKIMFCLSIFDILSLSVNSIATGFYALKGANFCDYPKSNFTLGAIGMGSWMGGCLSCIMLAINRCCDLNPNMPFKWIFTGKYVRIPLGLIIFYDLFAIFFLKPHVFSSEYVTWFFNPRINSHPEWYINLAHTTNNCVVSICTTSLYTYLCVILFHKSRHASSDSISKTQRQIFFQSVIICSFNAAAAYIYVYMQYFYAPRVLMIIGQVAWQFSNGSVCIVYLTMNRTIRNDVLELILPKSVLGQMKISSQVLPTRSQTTNRGITSTTVY